MLSFSAIPARVVGESVYPCFNVPTRWNSTGTGVILIICLSSGICLLVYAVALRAMYLYLDKSLDEASLDLGRKTV